MIEITYDDTKIWVEAAEKTITYFGSLTGADVEVEGVSTTIIDLLADLRHFCDNKELDWDELLSCATAHWQYETGEDSA